MTTTPAALSELVVLTQYTETAPTYTVWPRGDDREQVIVKRQWREVRDGRTRDLWECSRCSHKNCRHVRAVMRHRKEMQHE